MWRFFSEGTTSFPLKSASPCFSWFSMQNVKKRSPQTRANPIIKHSFYHVTPSMHVVEQISENKLQCLLHETFFVSVPMGKNLNKSLFLLFEYGMLSIYFSSKFFKLRLALLYLFFYCWPGSELRNSTHFLGSHCWC